MVEAIRKLVSGNRRRFVDDEFSLDLTYIIPNRMIAMSYPSHGFESLYRNSIDKVSGDWSDFDQKISSRHSFLGLKLFESKT